jgi:hypothetical protein
MVALGVFAAAALFLEKMAVAGYGTRVVDV